MSVTFNPNTFIGKKAIKALGIDSDNKVVWYTQQIKDFNIKTEGTDDTKEDAYGSIVATIPKSKKCSISWTTPFIDMNLIAAQNGTSKNIATTSANLTVPIIEDITVTASMITSNVASIVLENSAKAENGNYNITVMRASSDNSVDTNFEQAASAAVGKYTYTTGTKTITFAANDVVAGDRLIIKYVYDTAAAVSLVVSATDFAKAQKVLVLVEGCDVCDQTKAIYAYYNFPNATMSNSSDIKIGLDSELSIEMNCAYDYCSTNKEFYTMSIAQ